MGRSGQYPASAGCLGGDLNRRFSYLFSMQEEIPYYSIRETSELQYYDAKDVEVPRESI